MKSNDPLPYIIETERLLLRGLNENDAEQILQLDSAEAVLRYLPVMPIETIAQAREGIAYIRKQYSENGTGRLAMIRKEDGAFLGWCGIKWVNDHETNGKTNYYDIGYRLLPEFWNKGYAFEAAQACCDYAFTIPRLEALHATVMEGNTASARIAEKLRMALVSRFEEEGKAWRWYTLAVANR